MPKGKGELPRARRWDSGTFRLPQFISIDWLVNTPKGEGKRLIARRRNPGSFRLPLFANIDCFVVTPKGKGKRLCVRRPKGKGKSWYFLPTSLHQSRLYCKQAERKRKMPDGFPDECFVFPSANIQKCAKRKSSWESQWACSGKCCSKSRDWWTYWTKVVTGRMFEENWTRIC